MFIMKLRANMLHFKHTILNAAVSQMKQQMTDFLHFLKWPQLTVETGMRELEGGKEMFSRDLCGYSLIDVN